MPQRATGKGMGLGQMTEDRQNGQHLAADLIQRSRRETGGKPGK